MKKRQITSILIAGLLLPATLFASSYYNAYSMAPPILSQDDILSFDAIPMPKQRGYQTYTVKKGDTLGSISQKFFGTTTKWKLIASANNIENPASLRQGQVIDIPTLSLEKGQGTLNRQVYQTPVPPSADAAPVSKGSVRTQKPVVYEPVKTLPLPPVSLEDPVIYSSGGLPQIILPGESEKLKPAKENFVSFNGLTGLINTFSSYTLGESAFSTGFGMKWNKVIKREGERMVSGEDGDQWIFPILLTYSAENFEVAMNMPFESYDIYAPLTYHFVDGSDSGMGDIELRFKFVSENENMASSLGLGAIFPTSDITIGNVESDNAWEIFAGISSKRETGGNVHLNGGYQAGGSNSSRDGVFLNAGFDYKANDSFTFMGEINYYNLVNSGKSTDLTLGLRYHVKEGMAITVAAPISLKNEMFFGYDYRLQWLLQYHY